MDIPGHTAQRVRAAPLPTSAKTVAAEEGLKEQWTVS